MSTETRSSGPVASWKDELLPGAGGGELPKGYRWQGGVIGREELLDISDRRHWSHSEFVARAETSHTTSAVEAKIRRRHLEQLIGSSGIDPTRPTLELGCADGLVTRTLLELGFEKLISTDLVHETVEVLDRSIDPDQRERIVLIVDDLMRLPFSDSRFSTVIAWGVLSVTPDFDRGLELAWRWVAPGGHLLLAEPLLESVLVYALVRGDLDEFRRIHREGTRPGVWEERNERDDRYRVNPMSFYEQRLGDLAGADIVEAGGVNMLPSLVLGGLLQDSPVDEDERAALSELLSDPGLDHLALWRQTFWLLRKA